MVKRPLPAPSLTPRLSIGVRNIILGGNPPVSGLLANHARQAGAQYTGSRFRRQTPNALIGEIPVLGGHANAWC
jgi:hypothetical protein